MKDNRIHEGLYLFVYTLIFLAILSFFTPLSIGDLNLKSVRLLSDIEQTININNPIKKDSIKISEPLVFKRRGNCPSGIVCIEDFSTDRTGLQQFLIALQKRRSNPVRIAFYGDSFIEGDILTGSLRDTLQQIFGGQGQGYVPLFSEVSKFRTTIQHTYENLIQKTIVGKYFIEPEFGPSGQVVRALEENRVAYKPGKNSKRLEACSLVYSSKKSGMVYLTINDSIEKELFIEPDSTIRQMKLSSSGSASLALRFAASDSINLFGTIFEGKSGIYVDNLALRGNSGLALTRIPTRTLRKIQSIRPYNLIILQFGLNVISEKDSTDYTWYVSGMRKVIEHFKNALPQSSILLIGISDRSINQDGIFQTMPNVLQMRAAQRRIAQKTGILFWDTFEAMGGENSMVKYASSIPPLAGKDHTHLNHRGGQKLAGKLARALIFEINEYEKPVGHP